MPYELIWEPPHGVYRRYVGNVTIAERNRSLREICEDHRFDDLRYSITDFGEVADYEATGQATTDTAAMHIGPLLTNPRIVLVAVAERPDLLGHIQAFQATGFVHVPYRVCRSLDEARQWLKTEPWRSLAHRSWSRETSSLRRDRAAQS